MISDEFEKRQLNFVSSAVDIIMNDPMFKSYYRDFVWVNGVRYRVYIQRDYDVREVKNEQRRSNQTS